MSVLWLIEDSPNQLRSLEAFLTKMGHGVLGFTNPNTLLNQASDLQRPDAIIINLGLMGPLNGFQAAEMLRKLRRDIGAKRFIFTSGWKKHYMPLNSE